ncbi:MAG: Txe/YoeB family addiction module toxin [Tannerella sp.]|jgi:toxin YoeB|nr:Txe/YoeB family addiction module toxin [Tannerella sp.]
MYVTALSREADEDYLYFKTSGNKVALRKIIALLEDMEKHPYEGIGRPEMLKYNFAGKWSRRINGEHRIVYEVNEKEKIINIITVRFHYDG